jgi:hypothetical protein
MELCISYDNNNYYNYNSFINIPNYDSIVLIGCNDNQLSTLPKLPNSLKFLSCETNQLNLLPKLPNSLEILFCGFNKLILLPELPNSLTKLYCENNQFIKIVKHKYLKNIIYL